MPKRNEPLGALGYAAVITMTILSAAVAVWTSTKLVSSCVDAVRLRNAVQVDARIVHIERIERTEAPDAVYFTYLYDYQGETFRQRKQRLALFSMSNKLKLKLAAAHRTGETVPCYIDPDRPSLSLFSKEFSVGMFLISAIFPLAFGSVAVIASVSLIRRIRAAVRTS